MASLRLLITAEIGAAVLFASCSATPPAWPGEPALVIENVTVIDGTGAAPRPATTVVVRDGRIAAIEPAGSSLTVEPATRIDGRGRFLIPGLWDLHVHPDDPEVWQLSPTREEKERFLELFVAAGVTGVRDTGGDLALLLDWKQHIAAGDLLGPQIVCAGPLVDGPDPMWSGSVPVLSEQDGRAAVDDLVARGADFIKVYSRLTPEGFAGIAARCRELGVPFAGHVPASVSVQDAARAGMTSMEHLLDMARATADPERLAALQADIPDDLEGVARRNAVIAARVAAADPVATAELARLMAELRVAHVPTMIIWQRRAWFDPSAPRVAAYLPLMPRHIREWWDPAKNVHLRDLSEASMQAERALYARNLEILTALLDAGVTVLPGTDTGGNPHLFPGFSLHDELEILVQAGMSPGEALVAATSASARLCRRPERGTLAVGQVADMVLLRADPLEDIRNTRQIEAVVLRGQILDRQALDAILVPAP